MTRTIVLDMPTGKLTLSGDDGVLIEAFGMLVKGADAGHMPVPEAPASFLSDFPVGARVRVAAPAFSSEGWGDGTVVRYEASCGGTYVRVLHDNPSYPASGPDGTNGWLPTSLARIPDPPPPPRAMRVGTREAQVVAAVRAGCRHIPDICASVGATYGSVAGTLNHLAKKGAMRKVRRGEYALPEGA